MKRYFILAALFSFASLNMLLFGCTSGLVCMQKETQSNRKIPTLQETDKNWVRFRSKDGITTYIIRDGNGKTLGMRIVKEPWVNIPAPRCYSDRKTIPVNEERQEEVGKTKIARTQLLTSPLPLCETPVLPEVEKGGYNKTPFASFGPSTGGEERSFCAVPKSHKSEINDNRDIEIRERMLKEEDDFKKKNKKLVFVRYRNGKSMAGRSRHDRGDNPDIEGKTGKKSHSFGMAFPAEWLPGFVLRAIELRNGGDFNFKIPVPGFKRDVKFGLKFKNKRLELSNNLERTVIGLFTIDFGDKEVKKAANVAAAEGSYF